MLVLPNAWDAGSARIFVEAGFPALATTSAGIAFSLGYPDGERISRDEMLAAVARITRRISVPITADMEAGYGREPKAVAETVRRVIDAVSVPVVAEISIVEGPAEIRRLGQRRAAVVAADLAGRDVGSAAGEVREVMASQVLPAGVVLALSGQEEERAQAQRALLFAMALAIFLVYLVMASQFESFLHPFVIIFSLPLGAIGVIAALLLTDNSVNVVALIGAVKFETSSTSSRMSVEKPCMVKVTL